MPSFQDQEREKLTAEVCCLKLLKFNG